MTNYLNLIEIKDGYAENEEVYDFMAAVNPVPGTGFFAGSENTPTKVS